MILFRTTPPARLMLFFAILSMMGQPAFSQDTDLVAAKRFAEAFFEARDRQVPQTEIPQI
jgi:hypothetical protein